MSVHWMKQTLIASVLVVLMTLPATAQRRSPYAPRNQPLVPGKLEVPEKLQPAFRNAVQAQKAVIQAQIAALRALKILNQEVAGFKISASVNVPSNVGARKRGDESAAMGPQKGNLTESNPLRLQSGPPKKGVISDGTTVDMIQQQAEEAFFKLIALSPFSMEQLKHGDGGGRRFDSEPGPGGVSPSSAEDWFAVQKVKFDAQATGKELDAAIGTLNTQLRELTAVSITAMPKVPATGI